MVQVSDKGSSEPLVVIVKIEAILEVGTKPNGTWSPFVLYLSFVCGAVLV